MREDSQGMTHTTISSPCAASDQTARRPVAGLWSQLHVTNSNHARMQTLLAPASGTGVGLWPTTGRDRASVRASKHVQKISVEGQSHPLNHTCTKCQRAWAQKISAPIVLTTIRHPTPHILTYVLEGFVLVLEVI